MGLFDFNPNKKPARQNSITTINISGSYVTLSNRLRHIRVILLNQNVTFELFRHEKQDSIIKNDRLISVDFIK